MTNLESFLAESKICTVEELAKWRELLEVHSESNFLQSPEWAAVNFYNGHRVIYRNIQEHPVLMIVKNAKRGRYMEIPGGPLLDWSNPELVEQAFSAIKQLAKQEKCVFIRFRPQLYDTTENQTKLASVGSVLAPMHLGAQDTVILDLTKTEDELMAEMRRQTRYEVRQSEKKGISVEKYTNPEIFAEFHQVQAETAARQHFVPPSFDELRNEHQYFGEDAVIYVARTAEGEPIAYGLILKYGREAEYYEAASTDLNRKLPGAYALQWQVIQDLKAEGYERYNLWGIAPPDQPNHRYAGVTTFKTGFGGEKVTFIHAHDIIIDSLRYQLNLIVENIRKKKRHL